MLCLGMYAKPGMVGTYVRTGAFSVCMLGGVFSVCMFERCVLSMYVPSNEKNKLFLTYIHSDMPGKLGYVTVYVC